MLGRKLVRLALGVSLVVALTVAVVALLRLGPAVEASWALLASVLAVIAGCISAWSGQRVLELAEDDKEPQLVLTLDATSRYQLVQLRLKNIGRSSAHDVCISWDSPLHTAEGDQARFADVENGPEVAILGPGESVSTRLDVAHRFMEAHRNARFSGQLVFKTSSGSKRKERFLLSTASLSRRLLYDEEEVKTHYELQKIPDALDRLARELQEIRTVIDGPREEIPDVEE